MKTNAMKIYFLQLTVWTVRHTLEGEEKKMKIKRKINKFLGLLISCYQCCFFITTNYILVWMFSPVFLWAASHSSSSRGFGGSACAHSCPLLWQTHSSVAPLNKSSPADVQRGKSASCRQHLTLSQHLYKTRFIQKYAFKILIPLGMWDIFEAWQGFICQLYRLVYCKAQKAFPNCSC